jgi:hypothetical protein
LAESSGYRAQPAARMAGSTARAPQGPSFFRELAERRPSTSAAARHGPRPRSAALQAIGRRQRSSGAAAKRKRGGRWGSAPGSSPPAAVISPPAPPPSEPLPTGTESFVDAAARGAGDGGGRAAPPVGEAATLRVVRSRRPVLLPPWRRQRRRSSSPPPRRAPSRSAHSRSRAWSSFRPPPPLGAGGSRLPAVIPVGDAAARQAFGGPRTRALARNSHCPMAS